jgi:beta-lactamase regulating signal transducer with metallopeptidase domain
MLLPNSLAVTSANILATLINGVAGGLILTGIVWVVLRFVRGTNATTRFSIWWCTLIAAVALLFLAPAPPIEETVPAPPATEKSQGTTDNIFHLTRAPAESQRSPVGSARQAQREARADRWVGHERNIAAATIDRSSSSRSRRSTSNAGAAAPVHFAVDLEPAAKPQNEPQPPAIAGDMGGSGNVWNPIPLRTGWIPSAVLAGLLLIGTVRLTRVLHSCVRLQRVKRRARRLSPALEQHLATLVQDCGIHRSVRLRQSDRVPVPTVLGIVNPTIIIPTELTDHLTGAEFEHVFLHELGHVRRWDDWTNLLQKMIGAVLFFHPAVWLIGRQLGLEREIACDDWVIARTGRVRPYAVCLTKLVSVVPWTRRAAAAPGLLWTKSQFTRRIEVLLNKKRNALPRLSKIGVTTALAALVLAVVQFGRVPPVVAITDVPSEDVAHSSERCAHPVSCNPESLFRYSVDEPVSTVCVPNDALRVSCGMGEPELTIARARTADRTDAPARVFLVDIPAPSEPIRGSITYEQLVTLFEMGVTGDYVRTLRKITPDFSIEDLIRLRRAGVDLCDLENLHSKGQRDLRVTDILRTKLWRSNPDDPSGWDKAAWNDLTADQIASLRRHGISADYCAAVMEHGFDDLRFQDVVNLFNSGVTTDYLDDLKWADMDHFCPKDVINLWNHGVQIDFLLAAEEYGFEDLTVKDATSLHNHGVSEGFLEDLDDADLDGLTPDEVKRLRSHGVSADYAGETLDFWGGDICLEQVIDLYNNGVYTDYIEDLVMAGIGEFSVAEAIDMHNHGVEAELAEAAEEFGFNGYRIRDLIDMTNAGVTADYLDELSDFDLELDPQAVIKLRTYGVTADFIRQLQDSGEADVGVRSIIKYQIHGMPQAVQNSCSSSGAIN